MSRAAGTFGEVLRQLRTTASLSQEELAARAGVSLRGISDLERGVRRTPHLTTVRLLADALALTPADRQGLLAAARPRHLPEPQSSALAGASPLPVPLTPLVGRHQEVAELATLLQRPTVQLVTLTGPGGVGKTRLALAVAARVVSAFPDGVRFVDLAPVADPTLVVPTIAATLGVREAAGMSLRSRLISYFADKNMLLVVDNFEHLMDAAPAAAELLATSPGLRVLATSRARLHLRGEWERPVLPLPLPDVARLPSLEQLAEVESIALFTQQAQAVHPGFALDQDSALAVAEICTRLDGLPLAIELAAARIRLLPPQALLNRLERLKLSMGGPRDLPARQRTLRHTISWSHDLLSLDAQTLFRRLAVFAGGATLKAMETVANIDGDLDVFAAVVELVDHSLLRPAREVAGEPRFSMLETIREYALEHLAATGEEPAVKRRHAEHYVALAEATEHFRLAAPGDVAWFDQLEVELSNLRAVLAWATTPRQADGRQALSLWLGALLWRFWEASGRLTEGRDWLERALELKGDVPAEVRIAAMNQAAALAQVQGDLERAEVLGAQALEACRANGLDEFVVRTLQVLSSVALDRGEHTRAEAHLEESLAVSTRLGFERGVAHALADLGRVALAVGDVARAVPLLEDALDRYRGLAHTPGCADVLSSIGRVAEIQRDYGRATALHEDALSRWLEVRDRWGVPIALTSLGRVASARGNHAGAARRYAEALELLHKQGQPATIALILDGLAATAACTNHGDLAARLFGAAEVTRDAIGASVQLVDRADRDRHMAVARAMLGTEQFASACATGRELSLEAAVGEALAIAAVIAVDDQKDSTVGACADL